MAELKRFTDFNSLKLAAKSNQKATSVNSKKLKEEIDFFDLLRANLVVKRAPQKG